MNNNICVYFHINPVKNEVFYVGIGIRKRPFDRGGRNIFWKRTVKKYKGYVVDIVHEGLSWEEACEKEMYYIKRIGRRDLNLGPLVNMTNGGEGTLGHKLSDETKEKISKAQKGKIVSDITKEKMSKSFKGRIYSKKVRTNMSIGAKNRKPITEITRNKLIENGKNQKHKPGRHYYSKPIIQLDINGNFIKEWNGGCEIKKLLNYNPMGISDCCNNKIKMYKGFIWKFKTSI